MFPAHKGQNSSGIRFHVFKFLLVGNANINARLRKQNTFLGRDFITLFQDLIQDGRQFSVINFTKIFCFLEP